MHPDQGRIRIVQREAGFVGNVVADEEIEMAVAVVIEESRPGVPVVLKLEQPGFAGDVGEGAISVIAVQHVFAVIGDE